MTATTLEDELLHKMDDILKGLTDAKAERVALQMILSGCVAIYMAERDDAEEWLALCREASTEGIRFSGLDAEAEQLAVRFVLAFFDGLQGVSSSTLG